MTTERPIPEHVTAAVEFSTMLHELELLSEHSLYDAFTERMQDFQKRRIPIAYRREVVTLFKTVVEHTAKRQGLLRDTDFFQGSRAWYVKSPSVSLVLERPTAAEVRDIRGVQYTKQPAMAYVVSAFPSGSLLFARESRIRYPHSTTPRVILPHTQELMRLRPYEINENTVLEGLSKLFYEPPKLPFGPMVE